MGATRKGNEKKNTLLHNSWNCPLVRADNLETVESKFANYSKRLSTAVFSSVSNFWLGCVVLHAISGASGKNSRRLHQRWKSLRNSSNMALSKGNNKPQRTLL